MSAAARRPLLGGNWKMHLTRREATALCSALLRETLSYGPEVVLFPSFPLLPAVAGALDGSSIAWGGQDLHPEDAGAHTGDVSGPQLVDAGCAWVLCGHSERRQDHGETDAIVSGKIEAAIRNRMTPLICVGETAHEREAGRTFEVLERQLSAALAGRPARFSIAYEPVWAIGTGQTATPDIAQEAHAFLRELLGDLMGAETAAAKRILYGGSATPDNAAGLFAQPDIDGFLVGGASLDATKFSAIMRCCTLADHGQEE